VSDWSGRAQLRVVFELERSAIPSFLISTIARMTS